MYSEIKRCRICGNEALLDVLSLGMQPQAGVFPRPSESFEEGPLELVKCDESKSDACGLTQLRHSFQPEAMYGDNYGYRSGLNRSMVEHLKAKVSYALDFCGPSSGDVFIDIGSNDGTLLGFYPQNQFRLIGIDPTIRKFGKYYRDDIQKVPEFFSADIAAKATQGKKAKIITSISMFYDLEAPFNFVKMVKESLAEDGIWIFEQSYLPLMIDRNSYDTICHEHLEYYHLKPLLWMMDRAELSILDVELNDTNGGSFSVTAGHKNGRYPKGNPKALERLLVEEAGRKLHTLEPYSRFKRDLETHRKDLIEKLNQYKRMGKKVYGYGASTKGNVVLNYCGIDSSLVSHIAEVNADKVGHVTPGSNIPIIAESEARARKPDVFLVLPWHFREFFIEKEAKFISEGGALLFPLPVVEEVSEG